MGIEMVPNQTFADCDCIRFFEYDGDTLFNRYSLQNSISYTDISNYVTKHSSCPATTEFLVRAKKIGNSISIVMKLVLNSEFNQGYIASVSDPIRWLGFSLAGNIYGNTSSGVAVPGAAVMINNGDIYAKVNTGSTSLFVSFSYIL